MMYTIVSLNFGVMSSVLAPERHCVLCETPEARCHHPCKYQMVVFEPTHAREQLETSKTGVRQVV